MVDWDRRRDDGCNHIIDQHGNAICFMSVGRHCDDHDVDALLISAAPDLLAACEAAVVQFADRIEDPCDEDVIEHLRSAIARAKGE